jgi:hypothetical protein
MIPGMHTLLVCPCVNTVVGLVPEKSTLPILKGIIKLSLRLQTNDS